MRLIGAHVNETVIERLDAIARDQGVERAKVIRSALEFFLTHRSPQRTEMEASERTPTPAPEPAPADATRQAA